METVRHSLWFFNSSNGSKTLLAGADPNSPYYLWTEGWEILPKKWTEGGIDSSTNIYNEAISHFNAQKNLLSYHPMENMCGRPFDDLPWDACCVSKSGWLFSGDLGIPPAAESCVSGESFGQIEDTYNEYIWGAGSTDSPCLTEYYRKAGQGLPDPLKSKPKYYLNSSKPLPAGKLCYEAVDIWALKNLGVTNKTSHCIDIWPCSNEHKEEKDPIVSPTPPVGSTGQSGFSVTPVYGAPRSIMAHCLKVNIENITNPFVGPNQNGDCNSGTVTVIETNSAGVDVAAQICDKRDWTDTGGDPIFKDKHEELNMTLEYLGTNNEIEEWSCEFWGWDWCREFEKQKAVAYKKSNSACIEFKYNKGSIFIKFNRTDGKGLSAGDGHSMSPCDAQTSWPPCTDCDSTPPPNSLPNDTICYTCRYSLDHAVSPGKIHKFISMNPDDAAAALAQCKSSSGDVKATVTKVANSWCSATPGPPGYASQNQSNRSEGSGGVGSIGSMYSSIIGTRCPCTTASPWDCLVPIHIPVNSEPIGGKYIYNQKQYSSAAAQNLGLEWTDKELNNLVLNVKDIRTNETYCVMSIARQSERLINNGSMTPVFGVSPSQATYIFYNSYVGTYNPGQACLSSTCV
tara:strand:- start:59 stop:1936 length:1878 start_codon:yes stop_codon:yes gene_type:complete